MHQIVGAAFAPKLLLQCCSNDHERTALQRLGIALGIQELVKNFDTQIQQHESVSKAGHEQKQVGQDRAEDVTNAEVDEPSIQKEPEQTATDRSNSASECPEPSPQSDSKPGQFENTPSSTIQIESSADGEGPTADDTHGTQEEGTVPSTESPVTPFLHQTQKKEDTTSEPGEAESSVDPAEGKVHRFSLQSCLIVSNV